MPATQTPPYSQPKGRKFPVKAIIGAVIAVIVVVAVLLVVLPMSSKPSYPITASDLKTVYGGSWTVINSKSAVVTFSSSGATISYFNGTTKTVSYSRYNLPTPFGQYSQMCKMILVVFTYKNSSVSSWYTWENVIIPKHGTKLYTDATTVTVSNFSSIFYVCNVHQNGNIIYGYERVCYALCGHCGYEEIIVNKATGEIVVLNDLPPMTPAMASQLASYV